MSPEVNYEQAVLLMGDGLTHDNRVYLEQFVRDTTKPLYSSPPEPVYPRLNRKQRRAAASQARKSK